MPGSAFMSELAAIQMDIKGSRCEGDFILEKARIRGPSKLYMAHTTPVQTEP